MQLQYLCFGFFFITSFSMLRYLGVLEGEQLLSRKTRFRLDIFVVVLFLLKVLNMYNLDFQL